MSQISGPEIKHALRKLEYPVCAREALAKIGQLICGRVPSIKHMDLALDLMAEFVFCEVDRRGNKRSTSVSALLELQLLEVLFDFFNMNVNEAARNTVFLSLFSGTTAIMRSDVLSKLVSIVVGIPSSPVLISASTWMQQLGNTSPNSYKLAKALVKDYFILVPSAVPRLKGLPHIAPQFTANFLTAVADIYFTDGKNGPFIFPPQSLLKTITFWIEENSRLCVAAQQRQSTLPLGAIAMEATTPIAGLLKWCILAPIYNQDSELYGKLHLSLLNSITEIPSINPPRALFALHLTMPIGNICRYVLDLQNRPKKRGDVSNKQKLLAEDVSLQICLDRFAQAVQVALAVSCVYGNIDDLIDQLDQLPRNRLIAIVINTHKLNKSN